jgi:mxaJ protein
VLCFFADVRRRACPSPLLATALAAAAFLAAPARAQAPPERVLRICADPNALPFSNDRLQGFENRIAELLAGQMNARVSYTFWVGRRGFLRSTLKACACDVVMGLPVGVDAAETTRPYCRSTYVSVSRRDRRLAISSLDDPRLARLRIGVQMIGAEAANSPPAHALARRGIVTRVEVVPRIERVLEQYGVPREPSARPSVLASASRELAR